jgi:hypothetical protein
MSDAFWITPSGKYISAGISHIDTVVKQPDIFGLTKTDIDTVYDKYSEKRYVEGKAREEIIKEIINKGFIRIRQYGDEWSITVNKRNNRTADLITDWAQAITTTGIQGNRANDMFATVYITPLQGDIVQTNLKRLATYELFKQNENRLGRFLTELKHRLRKLLK